MFFTIHIEHFQVKPKVGLVVSLIFFLFFYYAICFWIAYLLTYLLLLISKKVWLDH